MDVAVVKLWLMCAIFSVAVAVAAVAEVAFAFVELVAMLLDLVTLLLRHNDGASFRLQLLVK